MQDERITYLYARIHYNNNIAIWLLHINWRIIFRYMVANRLQTNYLRIVRFRQVGGYMFAN